MSVILGLNFGHDGSVCIIKDGKLLSAISTERITKEDFFEVKGKKISTFIISHHLAHCASAYYTSPYDNSYCFSMDCSMGKVEANSLVAYGNGNKLTAEYCPGIMVGVLYGEVTEKQEQ